MMSLKMIVCYIFVDNYLITQAHEFQLLGRVIASLGYPLPDRVVVSGIISKHPHGGILPLV
jgi:hypothetical protein